METGSGQTYYDLSLVDGYNLPIGIISLLGTSGNSSSTYIPPNLTNPMCIGTAALIAANQSASTFGTNSSFPLPLDQSISQSDVSSWCPWELQLSPPERPGDGVYPYPDNNIARPAFDPCLSACAKYGNDQYCCTGQYDSSSKCQPSDYSTQAKKVCPDAYSYAYDDVTSTFIIPSGGGFEIVFCPPSGMSTTILQTFSSQLQQIAQTGKVSAQTLEDTQNLTLIKSGDAPGRAEGDRNRILLATVLTISIAVIMGSW